MNAVIVNVTAVDEIADTYTPAKAALPIGIHDGALALMGALAAKVIVTAVAALKPVICPLLLVDPGATDDDGSAVRL